MQKMSWIETIPAPTPFEGVLGLRPELLARYRTFYASLWNDARVPRRTLELCRLRIAAIHDCQQEWQARDAAAPCNDLELAALGRGEFARFTADEQAALAIAEQMPFGHHNISDAEVERVRVALGSAGAVALLTAIALFDVSCRLKLTLDVDVRAMVMDHAPMLQGALV